MSSYYNTAGQEEALCMLWGPIGLDWPPCPVDFLPDLGPASPWLSLVRHDSGQGGLTWKIARLGLAGGRRGVMAMLFSLDAHS